jgi:hypothetical protein
MEDRSAFGSLKTVGCEFDPLLWSGNATLWVEFRLWNETYLSSLTLLSSPMCNYVGRRAPL